MSVQSANIFDVLGDDSAPVAAPAQKELPAKVDPQKIAHAAKASAGSAPAKRPNHRQFERHSAAPHKSSKTKDWEDPEKELADETAAENDASAPAASSSAPAAAAVAVESGPVTKTLDDYLKSTRSQRPQEDLKIAPRQVVISAQFANAVPLKKKEEQPFGDVKKDEKKKDDGNNNGSNNAAAKKSAKKTISLDEFVGAPVGSIANRSGGGDRGDRGERRGGRGRGGRGGRGGSRPPREDGAEAAPRPAADGQDGAPAGGDRPRGGGRGGRGRGGDRGDRGGRGGRGGGAPRGAPRSDGGAFNMKEDDFPALGGR